MPRFPLTLMEQYLLAEDKPAYPCWIFLRTRLRGTVNRLALEQAWRETVRRHPTLHSLIRDNGRRPPYWDVPPEPPVPLIHWHRASNTASARPFVALDPRREPAVRLIVAEHDTGAEISLDGHHVVFDGVGAFAVMDDLFLLYARACGSDVTIADLRPELFPGRNGFGLGWWGRLKLAPVQMLGLWFAWQMQRRPVAALTPHDIADFPTPPNPDFPSVMHQHLPAADLVKLRAVAKKNGASLNDLLIRDLQSAIGVWRLREGIGQADDWIFLAVPVSLRRSVDRFLSAANLIGIVAIDRRARSLANRPRLLRRATEDMDLVKRHKLGYTFLVLLAWWRRLRGGIPAYSSRRSCRATTVLTNLGQPFSRSPLMDASRRLALPGAIVEDVFMVAPCRPGTCATLAVAIYGRRLVVDLHYDPRALRDQQAETFLATFFEQLYTSIGEGAETR